MLSLGGVRDAAKVFLEGSWVAVVMAASERDMVENCCSEVGISKDTGFANDDEGGGVRLRRVISVSAYCEGEEKTSSLSLTSN